MARAMNVFSKFETELAVRPDDIDLYQHVHSTRYLDYVLAARFEQMEKNYGMSMQAFADRVAHRVWCERHAVCEAVERVERLPDHRRFPPAQIRTAPRLLRGFIAPALPRAPGAAPAEGHRGG